MTANSLIHTTKKRAYMAAPLFSMAERTHNKALAIALEHRLPGYEIILPQERGDALLPNMAAIAADCYEQVEGAQVVIANLDGPDSDSGTSAEVATARAFKIPVIGYRTDFRKAEADGVNAMLRYGVTAYVEAFSCSHTLDQLADMLAAQVLAFEEAA